MLNLLTCLPANTGVGYADHETVQPPSSATRPDLYPRGEPPPGYLQFCTRCDGWVIPNDPQCSQCLAQRSSNRRPPPSTTPVAIPLNPWSAFNPPGLQAELARLQQQAQQPGQ